MKKLSLLLVCIVGLATANVIAQKAPKVDFARKIAEATPESLPQSPLESGRPSTDAKDENLRGKVRVVREFNLEGKKRIPDSETHYDETGNHLKRIYYDEGHPDSVTVFGYIDGMRVFRSGYIQYSEGELPPSDRLSIKVLAGDNIRDTSKPRDPRYSMRLVHRYDDKARLIETAQYQNNGELWQSETFTYTGDSRIDRNVDRDGQEFTKTTNKLDRAGNVVEELQHGPEGEEPTKYVRKYVFDAQGNWTTERVYEEKIVRGRKTLELLWTNVRTITYYP